MRLVDKSQMVEFLVVAASVDPIRVDEITVGAWYEALGHLDYGVARAALKLHRQVSTEPVKPAHIIALAKKQRSSTDRGIARPPAPEGRRYAVDVIEMGVLE